jgi:hypothetical protein
VIVARTMSASAIGTPGSQGLREAPAQSVLNRALFRCANFGKKRLPGNHLDLMPTKAFLKVSYGRWCQWNIEYCSALKVEADGRW